MKPHKSPRVRNKILSSDGLAYQPLEPRRMLAGDVTDIVFSADFEDANVAAGTYGHFANVSGFSATGADVEIQNNFLGVGPASEGSNLLELDGVNGVAVQLNERVDEGLVLKFDYSPRPKVRKALNEVEIWWNGELLNTVERNGRRLRSTDFQSYEVGLPAVESGSATLEFRSNFSRDRKGLGGLIDNVTVLASSTFPGLNDIADQELAVGDSIALTAELETPIEDEVTFSILNGPEGLQIDPSTGEITWVASQNAVDSSNADNNVRGTGTSETAFQSGFEDAGVPAGEYRFFESIDGFESSNAGVGVEIQNNHFSVGRASEGDHHLELDGNNGVFRNVDTSSAANWQLQLDFSPRPGVAEAQNEIELWWDGDRVETISGNGIALSQTAFTRHTFDLPQPSSDSTRLELRSDSPEDRVGLGGLVDNIVLNRAETTQTNGQQNKFQVVVQASNGSQVSTTDFLICIGEPGENRAPTLAAISQQQVDEETELTVQLTASDPDTDDTLTYGIVTGPGGATIDAATGLIRWTPTESDGPGQTSIVARVGDDNGGSDQQTISIQVNEVNRDPVLEPIANRMVAVDGDVSFSVVASDPDLPANELAFSLAGDIPAGASVDIATGDFSWTSVAVAPGQYPMQLVVTDGNGGSASQDFVIDVGGCSFEDSLTAWAVAENGGTASGHGSVVGESCIAILTEGDSFETTLSTTFVVPENSGQLNFVYDQLNFDTTDSAFINDAFEVALVDSEGRSLVDTYTDGRDAFYNITEGLPASLGSQVNVSDTSVVLDTSGILAGEVATLIFRLTNNDSDTDTSVQITQFSVPGFGSGSTLGSAKFYVADPEIDSVFTYDTQGQSQNSFLSASSSQQAHGLTSNADGSRVWSVDRDTGLVSVYGGNGSRLGAWTAAGVTQAEGIATDGTDIWIADVSDNTIHHFTGGSSQLGGSAASSTLLNLNSENSSPAGLTTNGTNLWIVDSGTNSVFVYAISDGSLLGSWQLDSANTDPSGITNDANGGNNLWVVDRSGTVFHYADATTSRDGVLAASDTFELNDRNASPEGIADPPIKFVALTTAFNNPIGIDYHEPSESVVVSVNYSNGQPHNFELIDRDGISERFSSANGFANEVKIATVKSNNPGGFTTGDLFVGNGVDGQIARVTDNGDQFISNWVDLPGTGNGLFRGGLFIDDTEVFGGDLIAVTNVGEVWRVTSSGEPTLIADTAVHLEGVYVVPDELAFGPIAGTIIAGAEQQGLLYSISAEGTVQTFDVGVAIEDIDIVRPGQNFFGVNFGTQTILGASASDFAPYAEGILLTQETHNGSGLFHLLWNGSDFVAEEIQIADGSSSVGQWEHVTFAAAGLAEISDPPPPPTILASVSRNELPAGQSVLIAGEASAFGEVGDGIPNDIVTVFANDLHVEVLDRGGRFSPGLMFIPD